MADRSASSGPRRPGTRSPAAPRSRPGCAHCYAETFAERWRGVPGHPYEQGFDLRLWPERLEQPLRWRRPRDDLRQLDERPLPRGHPGRATSREVFDVMGARRAAHLPGPHQAPRAARRARAAAAVAARTSGWASRIENRRFVHRADYLREVPAAVRFISRRAAARAARRARPRRHRLADRRRRVRPAAPAASTRSGCATCATAAAAEGVAFFFKQWGGRTPEGRRPRARRPRRGTRCPRARAAAPPSAPGSAAAPH